MKKEDIATQLTQLLLKTVEDVKSGGADPDPDKDDKGKGTTDQGTDVSKGQGTDKGDDKTKSKGDGDKPSLTLDEIVAAIVPKLSKELKLQGDDNGDGQPDKSKVNETIKETLKNLGFTDEDLDIDLVVKKKRKGESADDSEEEIIFKSKHETDADKSGDDDGEVYEDHRYMTDGIPMTAEKRKLNKELAELPDEDRKKALAIFIRGCM